MTGGYGLAAVPVEPYTTVTLPAPSFHKTIDVAVLGIGNHRIPNYELPSNIPGLTFSDPIATAKQMAPALQAQNDIVIALTHIGFTDVPGSLEVDLNVDTVLAAQTTGIDMILGGHSHTDPSKKTLYSGDYQYLPTFVGSANGTPVLINHSYRYNNYLTQNVIGLLPGPAGQWRVITRAGRYQAVTMSTPEDAAVKAVVDPYMTLFNAYNNTVIGQTTVPIDALNAYTEETNGANLQADARCARADQERHQRGLPPVGRHEQPQGRCHGNPGRAVRPQGERHVHPDAVRELAARHEHERPAAQDGSGARRTATTTTTSTCPATAAIRTTPPACWTPMRAM